MSTLGSAVQDACNGLEGLPGGKEDRPTLIEATKQMGTDVISVYKRIQKASKAGRGIRLSWQDASAIMCDGAVQQAIDTADYEAIHE